MPVVWCMLEKLQGRNGTREFARRSITNLDFLIAAANAGAGVHPVTQIVTALLAIVIFPWERDALDEVKNKRLPVAKAEGWPSWQMSGTRVESYAVKTIGDLIGLVRNSVAHGRVSFDSDSKRLEDVTITFMNYPDGDSNADWQATIRADHLGTFCQKFCSTLHDRVL
jgi:hypothetical protein